MSSNNIQGRFSLPGVSLDRSIPEPKPEQGGLGRLGGLEVGKKEDANPKLQPERAPLLRSDEQWVGRAKTVEGRAPEDLRNEKARGFVRVGGEHEPKVYVRAIDKPIARMVDGEGLKRLIGREPKPNFKLLGLITIEGSPRYAKALRKVEAFQKAMREPVATDPQARSAQLKNLHKLLGEARSALVSHSKHHPRDTALKETVNKVIDRMGEEIGLLSSIGREDNQEFLFRHVKPGESFTWASAASLMAGVGESYMLSYDDSRLDPERSRDGLGSGINGTVDLVGYDDGSQWIFKPDRLLNPVTGGTAQKMGIDLGNPRQGDRIIGTAIVDRLLTPPPKEGDPKPEPRETRRAMHNDRIGVLVPVANGLSPMESRPGPLLTVPSQIAMYDGFSDDDLQQMKVMRHRDVDVALSVIVPEDSLPEDAHDLGSWDLSARYGLYRDSIWRDPDGNELDEGDLRQRDIDPGDEQAQRDLGLEKSVTYRTESRPLTDSRSRELAQRFGAPIEHRDVAYQQTVGRSFRVDSTDPDLRRLLNIQECKDFVTGNHDRHPGNYKLEMGEDGRLARLNAYDDDETFPEHFDEEVPGKGYIQRRDGGRPMLDRNGEPLRGRAGHEVGLPLVMDREFATHLLGLSWEDFSALEGTIPDKALGVAKQRFELLQKHVRTLQEQGRLIDRDVDGVNQWQDGNWNGDEGETLGDLLSDQSTSYMGKLIEATKYGTVDMPGLAPKELQ